MTENPYEPPEEPPITPKAGIQQSDMGERTSVDDGLLDHNASFDRNAFCRDLLLAAHVNAKSKSFVQVEQEVLAIRQAYDSQDDQYVSTYILQKVRKSLMVAAIDKEQPPVAVDRMYEQLAQLGFHTLSDESCSALEYAEYCREHGDREKGIQAPTQLSRKLDVNKDASFKSDEVLQFVEEALRRLRAN